jgi:hypothetical protein
MSTEMTVRAMLDKRFKKSKRLCWFAFADTNGQVGIRSVMWWVNCNEEEARGLIEWFIHKGHAVRWPDGNIYVPELMEDCSWLYYEPRSKVPGISRPKITKSKRKAVFARDGHQCAYCGSVDGPFHIDHVHPLSRGGSNAIDNLTVACATCNLSKSGRTVSEWEADHA